MTSAEIELAVVRYFDARRNMPWVNIFDMPEGLRR